MAWGDFTNVSGLSGSIPRSENFCNCLEAAFLAPTIEPISVTNAGPVKMKASDQSSGVHKIRAQMPFIIIP